MRQTISQSSNHHPQQGCLLRNGLHSHLCLVKPPSTIPQINIYPSKKRGLSELMLVWGMVFFQSPVVCLKTANQLFTGLPKYVLQFTHCSTHVEPTYNRITSPCFTPILALLLLYIPLLNIIDITAIMFSLIITIAIIIFISSVVMCIQCSVAQRTVLYGTVVVVVAGARLIDSRGILRHLCVFRASVDIYVRVAHPVNAFSKHAHRRYSAGHVKLQGSWYVSRLVEVHAHGSGYVIRRVLISCATGS